VKVIITGGSGFIGCNAAARVLGRSDEAVVLDNLSRPGASRNLEWLRSLGLQHFSSIDLRNHREIQALLEAHGDAGLVLHLAGQTAVTASVADPRADFESNALATFNLLEAMRLTGMRAPLIYASTNKVYGAMEDLRVIPNRRRYSYADIAGIDEGRSVDFHSPYGCSKGCADQYVHDYYRIYGMPTVVLRQSCIYGYRQWGIEDQGWIAWFMIASVFGRPITIFGDGRQVRDVLFIEDLLDAYDAVCRHIDRAAGKIYNIGGGPQNALSLLDLLEFLERKRSGPVPYRLADWRPGDQRVFVSDIGRAWRELGWHPKVSCQDGLDRLYDWISQDTALAEFLRADQFAAAAQ
jgi:CDP-paratose 2-epimerase